MTDRTDRTTAPHSPTDSVGVSVNEQELAVLARIAGLSIAPERLTAMARDLTATLRIAGDLDAILEDTVMPVIRPFDPAWPDEAGTGR